MKLRIIGEYGGRRDYEACAKKYIESVRNRKKTRTPLSGHTASEISWEIPNHRKTENQSIWSIEIIKDLRSPGHPGSVRKPQITKIQNARDLRRPEDKTTILENPTSLQNHRRLPWGSWGPRASWKSRGDPQILQVPVEQSA